MTKADAKYILYLKNPWSCTECISNILPLYACPTPQNTKTEKFKVKCSSCNGFSYSPINVRTCDFCDKKVHLKCWNQGLGCTACCEAMIPGFHSYSHELLDDPYLKNDKMYNPYSNSHFTQLIGDALENESVSNNEFSEISEILINCKYTQPKNSAPSSDNELSIFSLNIQTLANKIDEFRENITLYNKYDVLLFNETNCIIDKLPNGIHDLILDGFYEPQVQAPRRSSGKGGGLAIYVNKRVCDYDNIECFTPYSEPDNNSGEFQFIKIKDCKKHHKTIILGNVYRSPSNQPEKFNKLFDSILHKLDNKKHSNKLIYIVGDFNEDLIKYDTNVNCQNLIDNAHSHGFVQIISRPTRITENCHTLIDHVYSNNVYSSLSCNILTLDISDHLATHTRITLGSSTSESRRCTKIPKQEKNECRLFNEANNAFFKQLINDETWTDHITDDMDAQEAYDKLDDIYMTHYNTAYPLISKRIRRRNERKNPKPWILPWLEDACQRKNKLYHSYIKKPSPENKAKYDKLNIFCSKHIKIAKSKYYKTYFEKYKNNSLKQWQIINSLLNRKNKTSCIDKLIDSDGKIVNTPLAMANNFNDYFSNIATNLKQKLNGDNRHTDDNSGYSDFLKNSVPNSIYLDTVDAGEIHAIINNFELKATLDTKISALKIANESFNFTTALTNVINKSFSQGVFPDQMKIARVIPIHKGQRWSIKIMLQTIDLYLY